MKNFIINHANWVRNIDGHITSFALARLIEWEIWEHDINLTYNPTTYPIFSVLWLYWRIGKDLTIQIKNGKISVGIGNEARSYTY